MPRGREGDDLAVWWAVTIRCWNTILFVVRVTTLVSRPARWNMPGWILPMMFRRWGEKGGIFSLSHLSCPFFPLRLLLPKPNQHVHRSTTAITRQHIKHILGPRHLPPKRNPTGMSISGRCCSSRTTRQLPPIAMLGHNCLCETRISTTAAVGCCA